ncbi:hypothetical protein GCM10007860_21280 [Chitiniphilus shinanonensis]|uniref:Type VI secretion system component TssM1 N-terminal domain-containing protein n=1 Tax=Chitiniphilus shinanonensis TaxID=553088 RepID=A0ABQ6BTQ1_9NEIS|nr:type VI secretion system protein [Chitiniphilus shinanonensis]GLS04979.1 hypothetical protein GCM10007860_21280 [Chitiniphilus shinanonensis]
MNHLFIGLLVAAALVALIAGWLIWRARRGVPISTETGGPAPKRRLRERARGWLDSLDYIATRREWRYQQPWVLLLGEAGAGKSSLVASTSPLLRRDPDYRERRLQAIGTDWHFFNHGVLIDPRGDWACALPNTPEEQSWRALLQQLNDLRPERSLDSLIVLVSARTLLTAGQEELEDLADRVYRQLYQVQQKLEFALPVYVMVTQCDAVQGFSAYWSALRERDDEASRKTGQMFGWSAPASAESRTAQEWTEDAFDVLFERLKTLQLDSAAELDHIDRTDEFFLFPRHFQQLQEPLARWLTIVFRSSSWHAGFFFRGMYFSGSVPAEGAVGQPGDRREDVSFVDDVIEGKVLAEPLLARRTRNGVWSRNKLIRGMQVAGCVLAGLLTVALAWSAFSLYRQVDLLADSLEEIRIIAKRQETTHCASKDSVYGLLKQLARIDPDLGYWAIPVSLVDTAARRQAAQLIADDAFEQVIMPSVACHLQQRATYTFQELGQPDGNTSARAYQVALKRLMENLEAVRQLEANIEIFDKVSKPSSLPNTDEKRMFAHLLEYVYRAPPPAELRHERGAYGEALANVEYDQPLVLPQAMPTQFARQLEQRAMELRSALDDEVGQGQALLRELLALQEPVLENTNHFTWWLGWVRGEWLRSGGRADPCSSIRTAFGNYVRDLDGQNHEYALLHNSVAKFNDDVCYRPAMDKLVSLQLPPYGLLFTQEGKGYVLNPALLPEMSGLNALLALDYMQVQQPRPFTCRPAMSGWRPTALATATRYAREYQDYARRQGVAPQASAIDRPLFDRLARRQLNSVMDHVMLLAQKPEADQPTLTQVSLQTLSNADQQLSGESEDFSRVVDPLLSVLRLYDQMGFAASRSKVTQCVRDYAGDTLARVDALAGASRLYDPSNGPTDGSFFSLGTTPVTKDYLARQVSRGEVLSGYASPYVVFLKNAAVIDDAQLDNAQTVTYWTNTIDELNRYVQFKEPAGQVGQLDNLFLKQFAALDYANCRKTLADYKSPEFGNDLFSERRRLLEQQVKWRCQDQRKAAAFEAWRDFATRFNRDLSGRYPFGPLTARDAPLGTVKQFFADYEAQRADLEKLLEDIPVEHLEAANRFLAQLDAINAFFKSNLVAGDISQPVQLDVAFRAEVADSPGSEQLVNWTLTSGERMAGYPNRATTLPWPYGQMLVLDLQWADRSMWYPLADGRQDDLQVKGRTASFVSLGEWALLRLIRTHAPRGTLTRDPTDPTRLLLEFNVPTANPGQPDGRTEQRPMRAYLGLKLSGQDPKTRAMTALTLPDAFPRTAPLLW